MKLLNIVFALLVSGLNLTEGDNSLQSNKLASDPQCIMAERIVKPVLKWQVLSMEFKVIQKTPVLEVKVHNPLYKNTPTSVDAEFLVLVDPLSPGDPNKRQLVKAVFHNKTTTVVFERIALLKEVKVDKKTKKVPLLTECFQRNVEKVIRIEQPTLITPAKPPKNGGNQTDGGVK